MKILFETDCHFKETGSMANETRFKSRYSTRLDLMIKSFSWFYAVARDYKVDLIVHGGDLLDKPVILAKEGHAIRESFAQNVSQIPEYVLVGNHDRKDTHISALEILANYPSITIVDKPMVLNTSVSFLPYTNVIDNKVLYELKNKILFSHVDIYGAEYAKNFFGTYGFAPEIMQENFELVLNGHIHTPSAMGVRGTVINTGAFFGSGLGDDYSKYYPSAFLIDTDALEINGFVNPFSIHYITIRENEISAIKRQLDDLLKLGYYFYLRVQCMNEVKAEVRLFINSYLEKYPTILSAMVIGQSREKTTVTELQHKALTSLSNPTEILNNFIKTVPEAKLPAARADVLDFISKEYLHEKV